MLLHEEMQLLGSMQTGREGDALLANKRTREGHTNPKNTNEQSRFPQPTGMQLYVVFCTNTSVRYKLLPVSSWTNMNIRGTGRKPVHSMNSNVSVKCIYLNMWHMTRYYIYANYQLNVCAVLLFFLDLKNTWPCSH